MSDTTEAIAGAIVEPASPEPGGLPASWIAALDLVRLVQGLYFIFWGLLVAVLVGGQIVIMLWLRTFAEIFLGIGLLAVLLGTWRLQQVRFHHVQPAALAGAWPRQARQMMGLAVLLVYFGVTFYMWRRLPLSLYLQVNAGAFVAVGMAYVIRLNRTVALVTAALGRGDLAQEARWFGVTGLLLLGLPFAGSLLYMGVMAIRRDTNLIFEFGTLLGRVSLPIMLVLLLPLSLTLGLVWAAKDATLRKLAEIDARGPR